MLQNVSAPRRASNARVRLYRDGDNNLDSIQESTLSQARDTSARDARIEFTVEDTTSLHALDAVPASHLRLHHRRWEVGNLHAAAARHERRRESGALCRAHAR